MDLQRFLILDNSMEFKLKWNLGQAGILKDMGVKNGQEKG
jgi:hypothetical protein